MWYAIVAILILIADQGLKYWVTVNIALDTGHVTLIPGVLELTNIHNNGAAFSMLRLPRAACRCAFRRGRPRAHR